MLKRKQALKSRLFRNSLVVQWVKDPALSLLWCGFDPWPGKFHMLWVWQKKKKKKGRLEFLLWHSKNESD